MVTLILEKTLVFWSGTLSAISLFMMLLTCRFTSKFIPQINCKNIHKYFVVLTIILVLVHATLALLSSFGIWI